MYRPVWPGKRSRSSRMARTSSPEASATRLANVLRSPWMVSERPPREHVGRTAVDGVEPHGVRLPRADDVIVVREPLGQLAEEFQRPWQHRRHLGADLAPHPDEPIGGMPHVRREDALHLDLAPSVTDQQLPDRPLTIRHGQRVGRGHLRQRECVDGLFRDPRPAGPREGIGGGDPPSAA